VVVLSASPDPDDVRRTYGMHANAYVCKPDDFDGFAEVATQIDGLFVP
jgi:DNA-binding NarL/FixJ family response regulator